MVLDFHQSSPFFLPVHYMCLGLSMWQQCIHTLDETESFLQLQMLFDKTICCSFYRACTWTWHWWMYFIFILLMLTFHFLVFAGSTALQTRKTSEYVLCAIKLLVLLWGPVSQTCIKPSSMSFLQSIFLKIQSRTGLNTCLGSWMKMCFSTWINNNDFKGTDHCFWRSLFFKCWVPDVIRDGSLVLPIGKTNGYKLSFVLSLIGSLK